eukprot:COSAG04_NODE_4201_length_2237_cov_21.632834_3_plen_139_part_00
MPPSVTAQIKKALSPSGAAGRAAASSTAVGKDGPPPTRKASEPSAFGAFGLLPIGDFLKIKGIHDALLPALRDLDVRLVSDLAYFDATHLAAAVRKRHGKASFAADVSKFVGAAKEARNGLRNVLGPLKRQLFDKQTL